MYSNNALRDRFTDGGLATTPGPKIVVMCYDRLDRDLAGAIEAIESRQVERAHELLVHAQDLLNELLVNLDLDAWQHAGSLAAIYRYALELLTKANVAKDAAPAREARRHLAELGDAFRQAAVTVATTPATPAAAAPTSAASLSLLA
jgi:flagellar secretion chaperone FliS